MSGEGEWLGVWRRRGIWEAVSVMRIWVKWRESRKKGKNEGKNGEKEVKSGYKIAENKQK